MMEKPETRIPKAERTPKSEIGRLKEIRSRHSEGGVESLKHSDKAALFGFRISDFGLRILSPLDRSHIQIRHLCCVTSYA